MGLPGPCDDFGGCSNISSGQDEIDLIAALLVGATCDPERAACALLDEFGSAGAALTGSRRRQERAGIGGAVITRLSSVRKAIHAVTRARIYDRPLLGSSAAVVDYLAARMRFEGVEQVRAIFLDCDRRLISDDLMWTGTADQAPLFIGPLFHRALELGSASLIIAHNHPAGDPTPSAADREITRRIALTGRALDIALIDHLIIARGGTVSMRALGLI